MVWTCHRRLTHTWHIRLPTIPRLSHLTICFSLFTIEIRISMADINIHICIKSIILGGAFCFSSFEDSFTRINGLNKLNFIVWKIRMNTKSQWIITFEHFYLIYIFLLFISFSSNYKKRQVAIKYARHFIDISVKLIFTFICTNDFAF